jgi:NTP pyrophosphatase (non-canonical NTP hydrolase)
MTDLRKIQSEIDDWNQKIFADNAGHKLFGIMEEVGELAHAHLREEQQIRMDEDHTANAMDAIGDIAIFLIGYCACRGWDFENILKNTWDEVSQRTYGKIKQGE